MNGPCHDVHASTDENGVSDPSGCYGSLSITGKSDPLYNVFIYIDFQARVPVCTVLQSLEFERQSNAVAVCPSLPCTRASTPLCAVPGGHLVEMKNVSSLSF